MTAVWLSSAAVDTETPLPVWFLTSAFPIEAWLVAYLTDKALELKVLLASQPLASVADRDTDITDTSSISYSIFIGVIDRTISVIAQPKRRIINGLRGRSYDSR